jgi:hypothetical protein
MEENGVRENDRLPSYRPGRARGEGGRGATRSLCTASLPFAVIHLLAHGCQSGMSAGVFPIQHISGARWGVE